MLILNYLVFKNNYILPNFSYGMLWYMTISTSLWYISMIGLMAKNKDDDDDDDDDGDGGDNNDDDDDRIKIVTWYFIQE